MTVTRARKEIAPYASFDEQEVRNIVNEVRRGKTNNGGEITLTASSATTTLEDPLISTNSRVFLTPLTANAAAALASTYFGTPTPGSIVINHANNSQTDRIFAFGIHF